MKLTDKQQKVLRAVKRGEPVRNFGFNTWRLHDEVVTPTVKVLLREGLVEQRWATGKWSKFDRHYELYIPGSEIDYAADDGSQNRQPDDITPDPEGECVDDAVTVDIAMKHDGLTAAYRECTPKSAPAKPAVKQPKVDALYIAWHAKMDAMMKLGRYATDTVQAFTNFDKLFAARTTR